MSEKQPVQRTLEEVQNASAETIVEWRRRGELTELLAGRDPGAASAEQQQQSTSIPAQVTAEQLKTMSADEIVAARKAGRLVGLGVAP